MKPFRYIFESSKVILLLILITSSSCQKFLDAKPSSKQDKLTVNNLQGLLDDYGLMNRLFSSDDEISSDTYFVSDDNYSSFSSFGPAGITEQKLYVWAPDAQRLDLDAITWSRPYKVVYNSNLVLETLENDKSVSLDQQTIDALKGSALFFRGYAHYEIAKIYAKPYNANTANQDLGIPVRNTNAIEVKSERGTLKKTYDFILNDLQQAAMLLPITTSIKSRPNKAAAYAELARIYLAMENYTEAGKMANECLKLYNNLIDYNTISKASNTPFPRFNNEVIFQATMSSSFSINQFYAIVNPDIYNLYDENDLRKKIFFKPTDGGFTFYGNYEPRQAAGVYFSGLATDEIYLIRAECFARAGNTASALEDLNTLIQKRWLNTVTYPKITASDAKDALKKILIERRKELLFRGVRFSDLRRLNKDPEYKVTLSRTVNGVTYTLPPDDPRYILLIPKAVIDATGLQQNPH